MNATTINRASPETVDAFGWTIQRGYTYRVVIDHAAAGSLESDSGEPLAIGYHGNDVPPCGADYLYADDCELLVISCESDPAEIDCLPGVSLERVVLEAGDHRHDGTWQFRVLELSSDGETTIAGRC